MLGVLYAALGAFTFSLNNVMMRRGVVTGSVLQGMALTVPIGALSFLVMAVCFGSVAPRSPSLPAGWPPSPPIATIPAFFCRRSPG